MTSPCGTSQLSQTSSSINLCLTPSRPSSIASFGPRTLYQTPIQVPERGPHAFCNPDVDSSLSADSFMVDFCLNEACKEQLTVTDGTIYQYMLISYMSSDNPHYPVKVGFRATIGNHKSFATPKYGLYEQRVVFVSVFCYSTVAELFVFHFSFFCAQIRPVF